MCDTITDYTAAGSFADIAKNVQYINNGKGFAQLIRTTDLKNRFASPDKFVYVNEHAFSYLWRVNLDKESLILPNVGNCGEVYYVTPDLFPEKYNVLGPNAILVRSSTINNRFLYHLFLANEFQTKLSKIVSPTGQTKYNKTSFRKLTIPVPPLPVQEEIVRILDSFTQLTAELQAELQARKKQYEYYRDNIILADESLPRKTLEEIAVDIYRGSGIKREEVTETGIPCVRYGEIYTSYNISFTECISHTSEGVVKNPKYFEYGDIIFTITGENVEEIAKSIVYLGNEKCMAGGDTVVLKHTLEPRYLSYALSTTDAQRQKSAGRVKSKVVHSSVPALKAISIPVPPMEKQIMIADVLDSFHYLIEDFSTGLPAEIQARQKQYEYYRDKLLTFPPLS